MMTPTSTTPKILVHSGDYVPNVGNAFVQRGAEYIVREATRGHCDTFYSTAQPVWFYLNRYIEPRQPTLVEDAARRILARLGHARDARPAETPKEGLPEGQVFTVMGHARYDLLVVPGMTICSEYIRINGPSVLNAVRNGAKVLFLGAGGEFYDEAEKAEFLRFLDQVQPIGIRTRDEGTYEMLKGWRDDVCLGMDCAFFADDYFTPPQLDLAPYVAANFDMGEEPAFVEALSNVVRTNHRAVGPVHERIFQRRNLMISDVPTDYLTVYANAKEVHSDRVHACVVSLAYGTPVRFYFDTPRSGLFGPVGAAATIGRELTVLDRDHFTRIKQEQIGWARRVIAAHFDLQ